MLIYVLTPERRNRALALLGELDDKVRRGDDGWCNLPPYQRIIAATLIDEIRLTLLSALESYEEDGDPLIPF